MDHLLLLFVAAVVVEGAIEYLIAPFCDAWKNQYNATVVQQALRLISCALGIVTSWQLQLRFFEFAFGVRAVNPWFDIVLTGIAIGRGSNYMHHLLAKLNKEQA